MNLLAQVSVTLVGLISEAAPGKACPLKPSQGTIRRSMSFRMLVPAHFTYPAPTMYGERTTGQAALSEINTVPKVKIDHLNAKICH